MGIENKVTVPGYEIVFTDAELEERRLLELEHKKQLDEVLSRNEAKARIFEHREKALLKLKSLGLTEAELEALLQPL